MDYRAIHWQTTLLWKLKVALQNDMYGCQHCPNRLAVLSMAISLQLNMQGPDPHPGSTGDPCPDPYPFEEVEFLCDHLCNSFVPYVRITA